MLTLEGSRAVAYNYKSRDGTRIENAYYAALDAAPNGINAEEAWRLIDFLHPNGAFTTYYNKDGRNWEDVQVGGSVTLCELTSRTFTSRFGYYGDPPVTIHLLPSMP